MVLSGQWCDNAHHIEITCNIGAEILPNLCRCIRIKCCVMQFTPSAFGVPLSEYGIAVKSYRFTVLWYSFLWNQDANVVTEKKQPFVTVLSVREGLPIRSSFDARAWEIRALGLRWTSVCSFGDVTQLRTWPWVPTHYSCCSWNDNCKRLP